MRTVTVDFHLKADVDLTWALQEEVEPPGPVRPGQRLLATDGDFAHWAVVDSVTEHGLLLRVHWGEAVP